MFKSWFIALFTIISIIFLSVPNSQAQSTLQLYSYVCQGKNLVGPSPTCSGSWQLTATCTGGDMVFNWNIHGVTSPGTWHIPPWEHQWITVIATELTNLAPVPQGWWMIGDDYVPDTTMFMGYGETHKYKPFPNGSGFSMPPIELSDGTVYLDLHGPCPAGVTGNVMLTAYYNVASTAVPPPPPPICTTYNTLNPADKSANIILTTGNLAASNNGVTTHSMVRAVAGIAPNTGKYHWEWTFSQQTGITGGPPINIVGLQDHSTVTNNAVGNAGIGVGIGYNSFNGYTYTSGFTPSNAAGSPMANGIYAADYDSTIGQLKISGPNTFTSVTETVSGTVPTLYPAVSLWGSGAGIVLYNFGASAFAYPIPSGYQAGLCQ